MKARATLVHGRFGYLFLFFFLFLLFSILTCAAGCNGDDPGRNGGVVGSSCNLPDDPPCGGELFCDTGVGKCVSWHLPDGGFPKLRCDPEKTECPSGMHCEQGHFCSPDGFKATIKVTLPEIVTADIYFSYGTCYPEESVSDCSSSGTLGEWGEKPPYDISVRHKCLNSRTCVFEVTAPGIGEINVVSNRWIVTPRSEYFRIKTNEEVFEVPGWDGDAQWVIKLDDVSYYDAWLGMTRKILTDCGDSGCGIRDNSRDCCDSFMGGKITGFRIFQTWPEGSTIESAVEFVDGRVSEDLKTIEIHQKTSAREKNVRLVRSE